MKELLKLTGAILAGMVVTFYALAWLGRKAHAKAAQTVDTPPGGPIGGFYEVKCFGGPCDGHVHEVQWKERHPWYVTQYLVTETDDEGNQVPDMNYFMGEENGVPMFRPGYAYYTLADGINYFYVRDINEEEVRELTMNGVIPDVVDD